MIRCPKCGHSNEDSAKNCASCRVNLQWAQQNVTLLEEERHREVELAQRRADLKRQIARLIITTTCTIEGRTIAQYLGILSAEVVLGTGLFSEFEADIADIAGARAFGFQEKLDRARKVALEELKVQAAQIGADAVVGVDLDFMTMARNVLMVTASGTAVKLGLVQGGTMLDSTQHVGKLHPSE